MEDSCPATPLILTGRDSKSPLPVALSSPESDGMKSPSRDSPDSRCVICLGRFRNKSFTDSCLHQFCFQCLLQWSKVKPECPLCKQPFKSIIHNVRSNLDYDQYHIEHGEPHYVLSDFMHSYNFDLIPVNRRFRYRSTMTREYFRELAESFLAHTRRLPEDSYQIPPMVPIDPSPAQNHRRHNRLRMSSMRGRQRGTSDFRRNVYLQDLWVQDLVDISGRYRECTPQFYRENPAQIHRIIPWLNREVNVLLSECESHAAYVLARIVSALTQHSIRSREFRELVYPYFGGRTDHFIHEFYTFARSVYDIAGFDQNAVYGTNPNYATEVQEILSSADDSDIEVLETFKIQNKNSKKLSKQELKKIPLKRAAGSGEEPKSDEPVAGPSGINSTTSGPIECKSDSDEVKILDYVKPEPLVVTIASSDEESNYSLSIDLSSDSRSETKKDKKGKSPSENLSSDGCISSDETRNAKHRKGKGKCRSNGYGLKGKQKKNYIKMRNSVKEYSESSTSSTTNSNYSFVSSNRSEKIRSRSRFRKNKRSRSVSVTSSTSSEYRASKSKKKKPKIVRKKNKKKTNDKTWRKTTRSYGHGSSEMDKVPERKKKVKSCVVVPKSRSRDSSPLFPKSNSDKRKRKRGAQALAPYWSLTSRPAREKSRKRRKSSSERRSGKSKRKHRGSSSEDTSLKLSRGSSSEDTSLKRSRESSSEDTFLKRSRGSSSEDTFLKRSRESSSEDMSPKRSSSEGTSRKRSRASSSENTPRKRPRDSGSSERWRYDESLEPWSFESRPSSERSRDSTKRTWSQTFTGPSPSESCFEGLDGNEWDPVTSFASTSSKYSASGKFVSSDSCVNSD